MDIETYLRERQRRLATASSKVKDFAVFDFNHIPDQPLMRDECQRLIDAKLRFNMTGIPTHLAIIGSRGSGKTLALKYLQGIIPKRTGLAMLYANCRTHNTSFKILAHLLGVQARGASLTELYDRFRARYASKTVVVLDEVDLMSLKDRRREILYLLSRSESPYMVVMLSNNPHILKELDPATLSSLQPELVHFRNYNTAQITAILQDRANRGLRAWRRTSLAHIAALTVRNANADARLAIKTLYYSVTESRGSVEQCFEKARRDIVVDMINDLADPNLLILRAVSVSGTDFVKDIYEHYCRLSHSRHLKPFSYVYFYSNLSYLQSVGLIALVSAKVGRSYTNRVVLNFDTAILDGILDLRAGEGQRQSPYNTSGLRM